MPECRHCTREFDTHTGRKIHESTHTTADARGCAMLMGSAPCNAEPAGVVTFRRPDGSEIEREYCPKHLGLAMRSDAVVAREGGTTQ